MICLTCGKNIETISRECPYCHTPISVGNVTNKDLVKQNKIDYDCRDQTLTIISAICFPYGLYYYLTKKDEYPLKSNSALGGAIIGIIIIVIICSVVLLVNILG